MRFGLHKGRSRVCRVAVAALSMVSAASSAFAQADGAFSVGSHEFVRGMFIDGDTLAIGGSRAEIVWRSGRRVDISSSGGTQALCGRRVGARLVIVRAGYDGVLRSDGVNVTRGAVPAVDRERIVSCAVDPSGVVYLVGEHHAAYRWSDNDWSVLAFSGPVTAQSAAVAADGTLYVATENGLLRRGQSSFDPVSLGSTTVPTGTSVRLWISDRTNRLYVAAARTLTVVDLHSGAAAQHHHELFGATRALTGVASPSGDLIALAAQSEIALFDGARFTVLPRQFVFAGGLAFDPARGALYVGAQSEVGSIAVTHPWLQSFATGVAVALPEPPAREAPRVESAAQNEQRTAPAGGAARDNANSRPQLPRPPSFQFFPVARFGFGVAAGDNSARMSEAGFAFDFTAGLLAYKEDASFQFLPELGVSTQAAPAPGGTFFTIGSSVLYGNIVISGGLLGRALIGGSSAGYAAGLRTGLVLQFLLTSVTLDLSYQYLASQSDSRHGFVGTISVNPIPLIGALFVMNTFFRIFR